MGMKIVQEIWEYSPLHTSWLLQAFMPSSVQTFPDRQMSLMDAQKLNPLDGPLCKPISEGGGGAFPKFLGSSYILETAIYPV